jgi:hypothetical protein
MESDLCLVAPALSDASDRRVRVGRAGWVATLHSAQSPHCLPKVVQDCVAALAEADVPLDLFARACVEFVVEVVGHERSRLLALPRVRPHQLVQKSSHPAHWTAARARGFTCLHVGSAAGWLHMGLCLLGRSFDDLAEAGVDVDRVGQIVDGDA